jgi:acetoin utilization deacetylase AcuC-like enzyme
MTVALITHPACLDHDPGLGHPECPDRLRSVLAALESEIFAPLLREAAPLATRAELGLVHPQAYIDAILSIDPGPGELISLDPDTVMSVGSVAAALRSAGGARLAVDSVMEGWARAAFVATRPPGHHAEPARANGFCFFANAAIAAQHARRAYGLARVAVLDFDVHHGNGTQKIFHNDPALFYGSSHQFPCFPGTGRESETGVAENIVNATLRPGCGSAAFRAAWSERILPRVRAFAPEIVIISAGFDAHKDDPLAELMVETEDFAWLTREMVALADNYASGRIVSVLEGGYDLPALGRSVAAHVRALMRL